MIIDRDKEYLQVGLTITVSWTTNKALTSITKTVHSIQEYKDFIDSLGLTDDSKPF